MMPAELYDARRIFEYDYIIVDAVGLLLWVAVLVRRREWHALTVGIVIAPVIYSIDAIVWWNSPAGVGYPNGTYIREYWIGGEHVGHPAGELFWAKLGADFMMTISYALFAFPWLVIVFRNVRAGKLLSRDSVRYTLLWAGIWLAVPLLSRIAPVNDLRVETVRHMRSQMPGWIVNCAVGYGVLVVIYRRHLSTVGRLFVVGFIGALVMEVPLYLFGIRPTGIVFVVFEGVILLNQGVPFLFLMTDKVAPIVGRWARRAALDRGG
jgi:hypothetical protein